MSEHLPPEKLELLVKCRLTGDELVEALNHVEVCDECYGNLPDQPVSEVLQRLLADDIPAGAEADSRQKNGGRTKAGWRARIRRFLSRANSPRDRR